MQNLLAYRLAIPYPMNKSMNLGTDTGSLVNHLYSNASNVPVVGKGATLLLWSDRHAYEIKSVSGDGKRVIAVRYKQKRADSNGMSDTQLWVYDTLCDYEEIWILKRGAWYRESVFVEFEKSYSEQFEGGCIPWDIQKSHWDSNGLMLIPGITRARKSYSRINVIFGVLDEHYDFTF